MKQTIVYVGLDIDDPQYHGSALAKDTGKVIDFQCRPTLKGLISQIDQLARHFPGCACRTCYEASYIGYTLQGTCWRKAFTAILWPRPAFQHRAGKPSRRTALMRALARSFTPTAY